MDYKKLYIKIIKKAKKEQKNGIRKRWKNKKRTEYEEHHILPKSLFPLWKNKKSNLVLLTKKEHFFCHELLTKIFPTKEMFFALRRMSYLKKKGYYILSAKQYEKVRKESNKYMSQLLTGRKSPFKGKHHTEEARKKISIASKGKTFEEKYGIEKAKELKDGLKKRKISEKQLEVLRKTAIRNKSLKGKTFEEIYGVEKAKELKEIYSKINLGKKRTLKAIESMKKAQSNRSLEWRKNISKSKLGEKNGMYGKSTVNSKKCFCKEDNLFFPSMRKFAEYYKITIKTLRYYLKNYNGFIKPIKKTIEIVKIGQ